MLVEEVLPAAVLVGGLEMRLPAVWTACEALRLEQHDMKLRRAVLIAEAVESYGVACPGVTCRDKTKEGLQESARLAPSGCRDQSSPSSALCQRSSQSHAPG